MTHSPAVRRTLAHRRLRSHSLVGESSLAPEDVVRVQGAMQSQEYEPAQWSVAQRTAGVTQGGMREALNEGTILRTHVMRPTWHFVARDDTRWLLDLTAPRVHKVNAPYYRKFELNAAMLAKTGTLLTSMLDGGNHLTRAEIAQSFEREGIAAKGLQMGYILMHAELEGVICSGVAKGKQRTYALLSERAPDAITMRRDDALAELTRRYFASHGPATVKDFSWWSGLTIKDVRSGIEMLASELSLEEIDSRTYWSASGEEDPRKTANGASASKSSPKKVAHFIQGYDEYIIGYSKSKDVFYNPPKTVSDVDRRKLLYTHAVLYDGNVIGHWKGTFNPQSYTIDIGFYATPTKAQQAALDVAAKRYGEYLGVPVTVTH